MNVGFVPIEDMAVSRGDVHFMNRMGREEQVKTRNRTDLSLNKPVYLLELVSRPRATRQKHIARMPVINLFK